MKVLLQLIFIVSFIVVIVNLILFVIWFVIICFKQGEYDYFELKYRYILTEKEINKKAWISTIKWWTGTIILIFLMFYAFS